LAELKEYGVNVPVDAASVELTIPYLSALNNLFERSILGKRVRVFDVNGTTIQRMREGFDFFDKWAKDSHPRIISGMAGNIARSLML
jgi:hypothetical protein